MAEQKKFRSLEDLCQLSNHTSPLSPPTTRQHDGKEKVVHVTLDTHGRKGKCVTMVSGLQHNPATLEDIARMLKQYCGAGGTVKDGKVEIQGDQRSRVIEKLTSLNYIVK